jgi:hypothetical protein
MMSRSVGDDNPAMAMEWAVELVRMVAAEAAVVVAPTGGAASRARRAQGPTEGAPGRGWAF